MNFSRGQEVSTILFSETLGHFIRFWWQWVAREVDRLPDQNLCGLSLLAFAGVSEAWHWWNHSWKEQWILLSNFALISFPFRLLYFLCVCVLFSNAPFLCFSLFFLLAAISNPAQKLFWSRMASIRTSSSIVMQCQRITVTSAFMFRQKLLHIFW